MSPEYYVGTSGWHYDHWRSNFYPGELPRREWLKYYSEYFNTVEINATFYRLPQESTFVSWHQTVPPEFCFAVKASRFITHIKRLKDSEEPLNTITRRAKSLVNNLGPLLYQLPPGMHRHDSRLETFLQLLDKNLRHVFEFRHSSWMDKAIYNLLEKHDAGFCIYDMPGFTSPIVSTTDFAYIRFHGHDGLYAGCYSDMELADWSDKLQKQFSELKRLYIYFNNDIGGFAIKNALTLRKYIEGK